ncbi:hypothetical protein BASA81_009086 [Batrachochytrium salamandrivorans]|nr:hypothetical protein BASA81_009086 [Batrachochytrium salamandrivorans]
MLSFALFVLLLVGLSDLADLATAKRLAGEGLYFLVLQRDGQVFAVGFNQYGQLGLNTTSTSALLPQAMLSVTNASDVSAGKYHSCLIDQGSIVKCVGRNNYYQLGDGTQSDKHVLVPTLGLDSGIEEVYCGDISSCARTTSGEAQCWGYFANVGRESPVNITLPGGIQSMSLGNGHACIVEVGRKLYCMGWNTNGQLGMGNKIDQPTPTQVVGLAAENIVSVACGGYHTCAVNATGAMLCWGSYSDGQLGDPSIASDSPNPVQVTGITSGAASAWTGLYTSFALMQNGTVWAFGRDIYGGVFGTGSTGNKNQSVVYGQGVSGVMEIRGGYITTCVLLQNDRVWCTGYNQFGQLGVGEGMDYSRTLVEMQLPSSAPTAEPTLVPTTEPTVAPTQEPTLVPTDEPTLEPTTEPTVQPTVTPTAEPTQEPTLEPTLAPTSVPTFEPTLAPTLAPTSEPTFEPTVQPTLAPTVEPTQEPTLDPTLAPSAEPTLVPTAEPTQVPTLVPTIEPTAEPTLVPTSEPTFEPTQEPSLIPTSEPTVEPTQVPTLVPTAEPTLAPTAEPTQVPTLVPTTESTLAPTSEPIAGSTAEPTAEPTLVPTVAPTFEPTLVPTAEPTLVPTSEPTLEPTLAPGSEPTVAPTQEPTLVPTAAPTLVPTAEPVNGGTLPPTGEPTVEPTLVPTNEPTAEPAATVVPTNGPTVEPTSEPAATVAPTSEPTSEPIQSPVEPPTVPANPVCFPGIGTDKTKCATLMKTCAKSNVAMLWAGAGCRVNGVLQQDGGCQCRGYCGYTCSKACNLSSGGRCKWNNNLKACTVAATGKAYVPRDSKYCPAN